MASLLRSTAQRSLRDGEQTPHSSLQLCKQSRKAALFRPSLHRGRAGGVSVGAVNKTEISGQAVMGSS
ncbi:hypothetical protein E2C01_076178 [Portunus trituberculatus]|uniref:Uncharacterized protein n=1 Tax=Portunus trituberculatus TaxID=210409 RepID=A0A5B7IMY6_PORTR|nr:hypothetical protein [Portunus trituberculatus]